MSDPTLPVPAEPKPGLSQWERVSNAFTAPSRTFEDIRRGNRSWWLPFLIGIVFSYMLFAGISMRVGWSRAAENMIRMNPKQAERIDQLPEDQRASALRITAISTEVSAAAGPVLFILMALVVAAILWGTVNFAFGAQASFGAVLAVYFYASLPMIFKPLLATIALFVGIAPESFMLQNYVGTNIAYYLSFEETNKALYVLLTQIDIVNLWVAILLSIGLAAVAGKKRSAGYATVFCWWFAFTVLRVGIALITG